MGTNTQCDGKERRVSGTHQEVRVRSRKRDIKKEDNRTMMEDREDCTRVRRPE